MTYTNEQLKLALAKMLPETIAQRISQTDLGDIIEFVWINSNGEYLDDWLQVRDTELLHLCWMVEETLTRFPKDTLSVYYRTMEIDYGTYGAIHATWQQRTITLAVVKGVEII